MIMHTSIAWSLLAVLSIAAPTTQHFDTNHRPRSRMLQSFVGDAPSITPVHLATSKPVPTRVNVTSNWAGAAYALPAVSKKRDDHASSC
jgi:hypothetical protein